MTERVLDLDAARAAAEAARAAGRRVVLANGCFDLLHVGHVRYLADARMLGDLLIVGVNGDASVRRLKGPGRPLMPAAERAELVASFRAVDHVVVFDDDTADRLVTLLRPAVHAKGTDYTVESVPERVAVRAAGGRVAITGDAKAHSTRDVIAEILARFGPGPPAVR
jgi:rfaE bifunctional protein nucleotidyltransferase chain/domain